MSLLNFRSNVYSQNGEDGILAEVLFRLGISDTGPPRWCVEFGAWDGRHLSNTFHLVESASWQAVYIEGDSEKFRALEQTAGTYPNITPLLGLVGGKKGSGTALDDLLVQTCIPQIYDILSIDIDSSDLDVWSRHEDYRPTIVVIEINSFLAPGLLQWHGNGNLGNSFSSTLLVATDKGYSLVCHTGNLIFVSNEEVDKLEMDVLDLAYPERLFHWKWVQQAQRSRSRVQRLASQLPEPLKRRVKRGLRS